MADSSMRKRSSKSDAGMLAVLVIAAMALGGLSQDIVEDDPTSEIPPDTCNDGVDNDSDGSADLLDSECDPMHPDFDGSEDGSSGGGGP